MGFGVMLAFGLRRHGSTRRWCLRRSGFSSFPTSPATSHRRAIDLGDAGAIHPSSRSSQSRGASNSRLSGASPCAAEAGILPAGFCSSLPSPAVGRLRAALFPTTRSHLGRHLRLVQDGQYRQLSALAILQLLMVIVVLAIARWAFRLDKLQAN